MFKSPLIYRMLVAFVAIITISLTAPPSHGHDGDGKSLSNAASGGSSFSTSFQAHNVILRSQVELSQAGGGSSVLANDLWGWRDDASGRQFALLGLTNATSFIEITDPDNPVYLGKLDTHEAGQNRAWRDIKVYNNHAFIVADGGGNDQGIQVFNMKQLLTASQTTPTTFAETSHYDGFANAHNIAINEDTGFAYVVGEARGGPTAGGLHAFDLKNLDAAGNIQVQEAGIFSADGYTHDAQSVVYQGPDASYANKEIVFASNENSLTIVDVSDKSAMVQINTAGSGTYPDSDYSHQGWLSEDHQFFYMNDELDEYNHARGPDRTFGTDDDGVPIATETHMWDVRDLENPIYMGAHQGTDKTVDHNLYVKGDKIYQANYSAGLKILSIDDAENGLLSDWGFFDTYMPDDNVSFNGAWSVYPYFDDDIILVSDRQGGLFILQAVPEPSSGLVILGLTIGYAFRRRKRA